jgi:hypothetical protein
MSTRPHRNTRISDSVAFQLAQGVKGQLQVEHCCFVHPDGANKYISHDTLRKAVIESLTEGQQVKYMFWREPGFPDGYLIATEEDYDRVCSYVRAKFDKWPMFTVLLAEQPPKVTVSPPTVPPPGGGPVIKT